MDSRPLGLFVGIVLALSAGVVAAQPEEYDGASFCEHVKAWPNGTYLGQMHSYHVAHYQRLAGAQACERWAADQRMSAVDGLRALGYTVVEPVGPAQRPPVAIGALTATVTWSGGLNVRTAPRADAPVAYVAADGATLQLTGVTTAVDGVTWWQLHDGHWVQGQYLAFSDGPAPAQPAVPTAGPTLPAHPQAVLVRDTAMARGASADEAERIAIDVIGRGTWDAFLRGADAGVVHGSYHSSPRARPPARPACRTTPMQPRTKSRSRSPSRRRRLRAPACR